MNFLKLIEFEGVHFIYDVENINLFKIDKSLFDLIKLNKFSTEEVVSIYKNIDTLKDKTIAEKNISHIHLNVAQVCNLVCGYCYGIDGEYGLKGKMKKGDALKAIDYLIKKSGNEKTLTIVFFGGEPLLHFPMIKTVVNYCISKEKEINKKFKYSIVTNGTKFNDEINSYLNDNKFEVTISFDGDKDTQDKNRPFRGGKGSYDSILPKVETFLKTRNGNATARATITNHSKDLLLFRDNLRSMGFKNSFVEVATLSDYSKEHNEIDEIDDHLKEKLVKYDRDELEELFNNIKNRKSLKYFKGSKYAVYLKQLIYKIKRTQYCGVSRSMRGVAVNGDVYPCHRFVGDDNYRIGQVNDNEDIDNKFDIDFINKHPKCNNCFAKYYCGGGGCIHVNYMKKGSVNKLDNEHCYKIIYKIKSLFVFYSNLSIDDRKYMVDELNLNS